MTLPNTIDGEIDDMHCDGCHFMDCTGLDGEARVKLKALLLRERTEAELKISKIYEQYTKEPDH